MRFKKQIIYICLFTFLFLPFQLNRNEIYVKAEPITMTYLSYEIITGLLLATGITITSNAVHNALVDEFRNTLYFQEQYADARVEFEKFINQPTVGELALDKMAGVIKEVYDLTYTDYVEKTYNISTTVYNDNKIYIGDKSGGVGTVFGTYEFYTATGQVGATFRSSYTWERETDMNLSPGLCTAKITVSSSGPGRRLECLIWDSQGKTIRMLLTDNGSYNWKGLQLEFSGDYYGIREKTSFVPDWTDYRGVNDDVSIGALGGSVCVDKTLENGNDELFDNSRDYVYPLDSLSQVDGLTYNPPKDKPIEGLPDVVVPDKPITEETDTPITDNSLWDTLFGWLKTLISPIVNLLSWIGDLLLSLLDCLKNLLISLFVPKEGYFVERFNNWKNDFSSKFFMDLSPLEDMKGLTEQGVKDIHFKIMGVDVVLKLSIINRIAEYSRTIATGVTVIALLWYNYRNIYKLIRGSSPIEGITGHYGGEK